MKILLVLCLLATVAVVLAKPNSDRGCIYVEGRCSQGCEEGTHSYTTGCGQLTPEPTCKDPKPKPEEGAVCDYSACYCNSPTVRDTVSGKCVAPSDCPKNA